MDFFFFFFLKEQYLPTYKETAEIDFKKAINEMLNSSSQELKDWATDVIFTDFGVSYFFLERNQHK